MRKLNPLKTQNSRLRKWISRRTKDIRRKDRRRGNKGQESKGADDSNARNTEGNLGSTKRSDQTSRSRESKLNLDLKRDILMDYIDMYFAVHIGYVLFMRKV